MNRIGMIGGSDISAVMGLSRWKTPLRLWAEKSGQVEPDDLSQKEYVELGTELEDFVAKKFERVTGMKVRRDTREFKFKDDERMVAHIDRRVTGDDAILECKTCSAWKEKEWDGEDIPTEYVLQVMWYMGVTGMRKAFLAVLIGGQKFVWKEVIWDEELWADMLDKAKLFLDKVDTGEPPMVTYGDDATLNKMFPMSREVVVAITPEQAEQVNELLQERNAHLQIKKDVEAEIDLTDNKIKEMLGECDTLETEKYKVTWKSQERKSVDSEKLKADGIYDKYAKVSSLRVFRTKKKELNNG